MADLKPLADPERRDWLKLTTGAALALALPPALARDGLVTKAIPSTGEALPVVGLGSSATFSQAARQEDIDALREVLQALAKGGASVFDTAPSYGASEEVAGRIANESALAARLFWATKLNVAPRGGGSADPAAARAQLETSFKRIDKKVIDLIQVHNMADVATQLPLLQALKAEGRVRYVGVTTTFAPQYDALVATMKREPLDFIGIDYAIDNRTVEDVILPLALERRIAVLAYAPFGRTRLFRRVGDRPLPPWAADFDAATWAQFFLKFVISHPAITVATPATSQVRNLVDNLGAAAGRMPDAAMRERMAAFVETLPAAS